MKHVRTAAVALGAALALIAVSAASASAHEFVAAPGGVGSKLSGESLNEQVFQITTTAEPNVTCTKLKVTEGVVKAEKQVEQEATVQYEECTVHDGGLSFAATVSPAKFILSAEGTVKLREKVEIKTSLGVQTVVAQGPLSGIKYVNRPENFNKPMAAGIEGIASVAGIKSEGALGTSISGTYAGSLLLWMNAPLTFV